MYACAQIRNVQSARNQDRHCYAQLDRRSSTSKLQNSPSQKFRTRERRSASWRLHHAYVGSVDVIGSAILTHMMLRHFIIQVPTTAVVMRAINV